MLLSIIVGAKYCGCNLHFLVGNSAEHIFACLLATCIFWADVNSLFIICLMVTYGNN